MPTGEACAVMHIVCKAACSACEAAGRIAHEAAGRIAREAAGRIKRKAAWSRCAQSRRCCAQSHWCYYKEYYCYYY